MSYLTKDTWKVQGICAQPGERDLWFSESRDDTEEAKALCHVCPVFEQCRNYTLALTPEHGVWAAAEY